ncbi:MAG: hypothetical protein ACOCVN_02055, partial [bacterium]
DDIDDADFPEATENETTNDAELVVYGYNSVIVANPIDDEYTGDLPVALKMDVKVSGTTILSYVYSATFNNEGIPSAIATDLTIEDFKFDMDFTNNTQEISANYKIIHKGDIIMDLGSGGKGTFTEEHVNNNMITHTDTWTYTDWVYNETTGEYEAVEVVETNEWSEPEIEEIVNSANAHFRVFDIEIRGNIDVKSLGDRLREIYPDNQSDDFDDDKADADAVVEINKYLDLRVIDVAAKSKIADVEAYIKEEIEDWGSYKYIDFRLVFSDNSPVDMETYFSDGFETFVAEINKIISDLNAEYDAGIETIEY